MITICAAAVRALRAFDAEHVAVVHPPWFGVPLNELGHDYYQAAGFDVVLAASCPLPSGQRSVLPEDLHGWAVRTVPDAADAVVIGGHGFRAAGVIDALEAQLGRPVLTANQGYGRLFDLR